MDWKAVGFVLAVVLLVTGAQASLRNSGPAALAPASIAFTRFPGVPAEISPWGPGFTSNQGQIANSAVRFYSAASSPQIGFATSQVLAMMEGPGGQAVLIRETFVGANRVDPVGIGALSYTSNFFLGPDPAAWRAGVSSYREVVYPRLYDGIDLVYAISATGTKYTFLAQPGSEVGAIAIRFEGIQGLELDAAANLHVGTSVGDLVDTAPVADQAGLAVECGFALKDARTVGFRCSGTDPTQELRIDPLLYATYLGGAGPDWARGVAADSSGDAYVAGFTGSVEFPATPGAFDRTFAGGCFYSTCGDAFVAKLNASGTGLVYATFLGGSGYDEVYAIAVDGLGNAYVTGNTSSSDFPTTSGAYDRTYHGGGDAFAVELSPAGSTLLYSTFLGGTGWDGGYSIALDGSRDAYLTGLTGSADFPTTAGAYNRTAAADISGGAVFVSKLSPAGNSLVYSTYIGAGTPQGIEVDNGGNAYIGGYTAWPYFPVTAGAYRTTVTRMDGFVAKLDAAGASLVYSTFLGGVNYDYVRSIVLDSAGDAFVTGETNSTDFPVTSGAWNTTYPFQSNGAVYVAELNPAGTALVYSTFLGGTGFSRGLAIAVDGGGDAYVTGVVFGSDFPTTPGALEPTSGGTSGHITGFISKLNPTGTTLLASTYFGGTGGDSPNDMALDASGMIYLAGQTSSMDFPVTQGAFDTTPHINYTSQLLQDAFVAKLNSLTGTLSYKISGDTAPTALQVVANGTAYTAPFVFWCSSGASVWVNATSPQLLGSYQYYFSAWSDGGAQDHTIACTGDLTLTAYFTTIPQADFVLLASPSRTSTAPGGNATVDLTVLGLNGYAGPIVTFSLAGAPAGVTGTFSPTFVAPSGTATLILAVSSVVGAGVYPLSIRGSNGTANRSVPFQLEVLGLQVSTNTTALAIEAGSYGSATVNVTLKGNYTSPVVLSVTGLPAGVGVSFTTAQFSATGVATLTFIVASNAKTGTYPLTLSAAGAGVTRTVSLSLQILAGGGTPTGNGGTTGAVGDWAVLLGWFLGVAAVVAAVIYVLERRKR